MNTPSTLQECSFFSNPFLEFCLSTLAFSSIPPTPVQGARTGSSTPPPVPPTLVERSEGRQQQPATSLVVSSVLLQLEQEKIPLKNPSCGFFKILQLIELLLG